VLNTYAVVGLLAMWARSWPAKRLLQAGIGLHLALSAWMRPGTAQARGRGRRRPAAGRHGQVPGRGPCRQLQYAGTFAQSFVQNAKDYWDFVFHAFTQWPQTWPLLVLSLMLIGMGLYKLGVLTGKASTGTLSGPDRRGPGRPGDRRPGRDGLHAAA
jgi:uncharacterized protein